MDNMESSPDIALPRDTQSTPVEEKIAPPCGNADSGLPDSVPPRWGAIILVSLLQGAGLWLFPKAPFLPLLALVCVLPTVFYLTERALPGRRVWLPPFVCLLFWCLWAGYSWYVAGFTAVSKVTTLNGVLYFLFVFLSLPFVQALAEFGTLRLPAAVFSARMNRNVTLLLLGGLALLPVGAILTIALANIRWDEALLSEPFLTWNPVSPFGFVCLFGPLTFAGAVAWAQFSGKEGAALPFLRKAIGAVSGWVALLAALGMAGTMASGIFIGGNLLPDAAASKFFILVLLSAFFWVGMSLTVREGAWAAKPRIFREGMRAGVFVFFLFTVCLLGGYAALRLSAKDAFPQWNWPAIGLGILFLASLGHCLMALIRKWPEKAGAVNVAIHALMLAVLLVSRLPLADPMRLQAAYDADRTQLRGDDPARWGVEKLEHDYGRYGREQVDRALAAKGLTRAQWEEQYRYGRKSAALQAERNRQRLQTVLAEIPKDPPDSVVPPDAYAWLIEHGPQTSLHYMLTSEDTETRKLIVRDLNHDGVDELIFVNFDKSKAVVVGKNESGCWGIVGDLALPRNVPPEGTVAQRPSPWDDLVVGGVTLPFREVPRRTR